MQLEINGRERDVGQVSTLPELLVVLELEPLAVLIEHNGHALLRSEWASIQLQSGDTLEILQVAAGG